MMFINLILVIDLFVDFILVFCWINKLNLLNSTILRKILKW